MMRQLRFDLLLAVFLCLIVVNLFNLSPLGVFTGFAIGMILFSHFND